MKDSDFVFDTFYTDGGRFVFQSLYFPQGKVTAAVDWAERKGVARYVRAVCQPGAEAVLRSRASWATRDEAERAMRGFLHLIVWSKGI